MRRGRRHTIYSFSAAACSFKHNRRHELQHQFIVAVTFASSRPAFRRLASTEPRHVSCRSLTTTLLRGSVPIQPTRHYRVQIHCLSGDAPQGAPQDASSIGPYEIVDASCERRRAPQDFNFSAAAAVQTSWLHSSSWQRHRREFSRSRHMEPHGIAPFAVRRDVSHRVTSYAVTSASETFTFKTSQQPSQGYM